MFHREDVIGARRHIIGAIGAEAVPDRPIAAIRVHDPARRTVVAADRGLGRDHAQSRQRSQESTRRNRKRK